jgi:hypothetical protein
VVGQASEKRTRSFRWGSGDGTRVRGLVRNKGSLSGCATADTPFGNDQPARDRVGLGR